MIIHENVDQGSMDWYQLRLGIPTASCFDKIITPSGKISESETREKYMDLLIAEKLLNRSLESLDGLEWIERGKELEPMAVKMYEFEQGVETKPVGFITTDDGQIGASPDRLIIGKNGAVELKCPAPQTHIGYMRREFQKDYKVQVQGQMYVCELDFVDRYSFHPELPPYFQRTYRDDTFILIIEEGLKRFNDERLETLERIQRDGYFEERKKIMLPVDTAYAGDSIEAGEAATKLLGGI